MSRLQLDGRYDDDDVEVVAPRIIVLVSLVTAAFMTANAFTWVEHGVLPALALLFLAPAVLFVAMLGLSFVRRP